METCSAVFFPWLRCHSGPRSLHFWSCEITLRHSTLGRTPLNDWSARRRDVYLKTHRIHQTSMFLAGFEPAIPASHRPQKRLRPRGHWDQLPTFEYFDHTSLSLIPIPSHNNPVTLLVTRTCTLDSVCILILTLILPRSRTGTVWFYTSTSNKRAARPKLYTKSLTRDFKRMYSRLTLVRIFINL